MPQLADIVDSEKGGLQSSSEGLVCHAKESGLELINKALSGMVGVFSQAPAKKATVYRNLQYRKATGVFCTFTGHEAGEQFAILGTCESNGNSLPEVQAISGCVACVEF